MAAACQWTEVCTGRGKAGKSHAGKKPCDSATGLQAPNNPNKSKLPAYRHVPSRAISTQATKESDEDNPSITTSRIQMTDLLASLRLLELVVMCAARR